MERTDLILRDAAKTPLLRMRCAAGAPMRTDLFDFELPPGSIALRPASPRDAARMLVVRPGAALQDGIVADLPQMLRPGDQLVVNDTKVISAQLTGRRIGRDTEPKIEATLIKRLDGSRWQALVKPAKKLTQGDIVRFGNEGKVCLLGHLDAQVERKGEDGEITLSFSFHGPALDQAIADLGAPPLPPYIASKRTPDERDIADYQTMSPPPRPACILRRRSRRRCASAASAFTGSRCMWGPGRSCRSRPRTRPRTRCIRSGARSRAKPPMR
jgi:hypothetical protein